MTDAEDIRYSRHIGLPGIGMQGQQKLEAATVLVVGLVQRPACTSRIRALGAC